MIGQAKIISLLFWKYYWITMRPYLLFVSGITGLVGLSFAPKLSTLETAVLFLVFFLSYGFGQGLTDCFQTDTDSISSPYRPLVSGLISKRDVLLTSIVGLIICGIILTYFSIVNLVLASVDIIGLATYTFFKRRWWGGPFYNGWIVVVLCLIGYNSGIDKSPITFTASFNFTLLSVLFGYANFVLVGYFKDIEADRATGYNTLPVVFGRKAAAYSSDFFAVVFVASRAYSSILVWQSNSKIIFVVMVVIAISVSIYTQIQLHKVSNDENAYKAVVPSVHTYILMLSAIVVANKDEWLIPVIIFYAGFVVTIKLRPERSQI